MIVFKVNNFHVCATKRTGKWVVAKSNKDGGPPPVETSEEGMSGFGDGAKELIVRSTMASIKTGVANHFKMPVRDMTDKSGDKIQNGNGFFNIDIIFMAIVVEGNKITIVGINSGSSDDGTAKIATDVFDDSFGVALCRFGINIKTEFVVGIAKSFNTLERSIKMKGQLIEESSAKSISEVIVIEVSNITPEAIIAESTFGNKAMDMRIPLEITTESM